MFSILGTLHVKKFIPKKVFSSSKLYLNMFTDSGSGKTLSLTNPCLFTPLMKIGTYVGRPDLFAFLNLSIKKNIIRVRYNFFWVT